MSDGIDTASPSPSPEQQGDAAAAGPQSQPANPAANPPAAVANVLGTSAQSQQPQQPQQPAPSSPQQQAAAADTQHHSFLGKVASVLLGKQTQYSVDPQTGQTVTTQVKEKPGDLFRHILAGAIMGAASAHDNSFLGGFAQGGAAVIQQNQAQDQQKYARAQQQFQNQKTVGAEQRAQRGESRADQNLELEKQKNTAQFEMWNKEQILHERDANLRVGEFNQRANESSVQMQKWAQEAGGVDAPLPGNNQVGNGKAMAKLFTDSPEKFQAPAGYDRFITQDHDTTGLTYDKDKGYVDSDGNPVNLEDRTTWHVSFIPQKPQPLDITGATLNRLFPKTTGGVAVPKQIYHMPFNQLTGLATTEHEVSRRDDDEAYKRTHDDIRADMDELKSKANNFTRQADEAERQGDRSTAQQLRQQAEDAYDQYDDVKKQSNPHSQLRKSDSGRPNPNNPASTSGGPQFVMKDVDVAPFSQTMGINVQRRIPGMDANATEKTLQDLNKLQSIQERQKYIEGLKVPEDAKAKLRRASLSVEKRPPEFSSTPDYAKAVAALDKLSPEAQSNAIESAQSFTEQEKAVLRKHYSLQ